MRDPARIPVVLEAIREFWEQHPDWRLGQLIENASGSRSTFNIEDDALLEGLQLLDLMERL